MLEIRQLVEQDAEQLFNLRHECSHLAPEAFHGVTTVSNEEEKQRQIQGTASRLASTTPNRFFLGAFEAGTLLGSIAFEQKQSALVKHRGTIFAVMVKPDQRGKSIASQLMLAAIEEARKLPELEQIELGVHAENPSAIHIYEKLGFQRYSTIPRAIKSGDKYIDEYEMVLFLDK